MNWLENIGKWFIGNQETILAVLTAVQASGLVVFIAWSFIQGQISAGVRLFLGEISFYYIIKLVIFMNTLLGYNI